MHPLLPSHIAAGLYAGTSAYQGLRLAHADIAYITIKGDGVVLDNLTFTAPVPEPEAYALMLAGLGVVVFAARRRQRAA